MKKGLLSVLMVFVAMSSMAEVKIGTEAQGGYSNTTLLSLMEKNLDKVLGEINKASEEGRNLNTAGLPMDDFAKKMLVSIWAQTHFSIDYDDGLVTGQGWPMKNGITVTEIPATLNINGNVQAITAELDLKGTITDFRFTLENNSPLMMLQGGENVMILEEKMIIQKFMDRFATAYCQKDLPALKQIFSDDALIITGNVVNSRESGMPKITYKKQNKEEYLNNLARAFARNKFVNVKFFGPDKTTNGYEIIRSRNNPDFYGVQCFQEWRSSNYSDDGYVFLLWDFTDKERPVIHVRTWQPNRFAGQELPEDEIFTIDDFENSIPSK